MKLYAISDLHLSNRENRALLDAGSAHPDDWLILAGDIGETETALRYALRALCPRFAKIVWVPGNHELWSMSEDDRRGDEKYRHLVEVCRAHQVLTPEDPYPVWPGPGPHTIIVPLFLLYDYTFVPSGISTLDAVAWARASGIVCVDEERLFPDPYPSLPTYCRARALATAKRLSSEIPSGAKTVLVNHFPMRRELARLPATPRFSVWCGTRMTEPWPVQFSARAVVYGHLHRRGRHTLDGVEHLEVSMGYPHQRPAHLGFDDLLVDVFG